MGILDWVFGHKRATTTKRAASASSAPTASLEFDTSWDFAHYGPRDFFGQYAKSANRVYVLAWQEGRERKLDGSPGGKTLGQYLLFENRKLIAEGRMARPNDGKVADNGTFILNDWEFGNALSGTFFAFNKEGRLLIQREFTANLYNNGLSPDGRFAVCQTCNSDTEDSSLLTIFDLSQRAVVASWEPEAGWADKYDFAPDGKIIKLKYGNTGSFRYSVTGEFLDRKRFQEIQLTQGTYDSILNTVNGFLRSRDTPPTPELNAELLQAIDRVFPTVPPLNFEYKSLALKLKGICLENQGSLQEALDCYDKALTVNPKVGVKQRANKIRKSLAPK